MRRWPVLLLLLWSGCVSQSGPRIDRLPLGSEGHWLEFIEYRTHGEGPELVLLLVRRCTPATPTQPVQCVDVYDGPVTATGASFWQSLRGGGPSRPHRPRIPH